MRRLLRWLGIVVGSLVIALLAAWALVAPAVPDAFYAAPATIPAEPGALLRQEPFDRELPDGARAWRILYTTTDPQGAPRLASAVVMLARSAPAGPRPVVLYAHGTTGVVTGCAPSLLDDPFPFVPGLDALLDHGWLYVATDYAGQATAGPHRYLIGEGEARSALDAVRATRRMTEVQADQRTVVWGHSQGGHAALWTGILAPTYAPDVTLAGVVGAAPATDLPSLFDAVQHTPVGRLMAAYLMRGYADAYTDVRWEDYVRGPVVRWTAHDMAARCLIGGQGLVSGVQALALGGSIFSAPPSSGALGARLQQNSPDQPLPQPVLIAQGELDDLVLPDVQAKWVARRCAAGQVLDYRSYPGRNHITLVTADSPFVADLVSWTEARFAGQPAPTACSSK